MYIYHFEYYITMYVSIFELRSILEVYFISEKVKKYK